MEENKPTEPLSRHEVVNQRRVTFSGGISYDRAESIFRFLVEQGFSVTVEEQGRSGAGWIIEAVANGVNAQNNLKELFGRARVAIVEAGYENFDPDLMDKIDEAA